MLALLLHRAVDVGEVSKGSRGAIDVEMGCCEVSSSDDGSEAGGIK
jgi:hypothetical protein